jgi:hypothetical protein
MTARQLEEDVEAGLGFVVLKTVIAEDAAGSQSMRAWAIREARMVAERITGRSGEEGWTISWKGRGWWQSFDEYLQLVRDAQSIAGGTGTLIVPSCKYHLPTPDEAEWRIAEYDYTTRRLLEAWLADGGESRVPMPLEKDFSPTLAGSDRATQQAKILEWLRTVPRLIRNAACRTQFRSVQDGDNIAADGSSGRNEIPSCGAEDRSSPVRVGLKLFNAMFDDDFQLEMLRTIHEPGRHRPDFHVYANRLFDPDREFDGHRGIAYGGPDLSDRNLRVMSRFAAESEYPPLEWSATGNITSGQMALEYAIRGATSFQLHTFFQLPADQYAMKSGSKTQKALLELYFHPQTGFIVWMHHIAAALGLARDPIRFSEVVGQCREMTNVEARMSKE